MSKPLPQWRRDKIAVAARKATLGNCECGQYVLAGLDGDVCAFPAMADAMPLTYPGELGCALSEGRTTYAVAGGELHRRYRTQLETASTYPVVAEHRCGHPINAAWIQTPAMRAADEVNSFEPPF